tara:strand:+ start:155 stop:559 length:405 start_codon:yes stop_codon:yes gene_type:complete
MDPRKLRILCVGDSLGMPRNGIPYDCTWFYFLNQMHSIHEYVPRFQRAMTTDNLVGSNKSDFLENYSPDIVIMQLGIVDCAPRYLPELSFRLKIINRLPFGINKTFWKLLKKHKTRNPKYANVVPPKFRKNLTD